MDDGLSCDADAGPPAPPTCDGKTASICRDGSRVTEDCEKQGLPCMAGYGCVMCKPGEVRCDGDVPETCREDGMGFERGERCEATSGAECREGEGCHDLCDDAESSRSYIGCDYFAITTPNTVDKTFAFAVVAANPQTDYYAKVEVESDGVSVASASLAPGEVRAIELPWTPLGGRDDGAFRLGGSAYHVTSSVPITVFQFSPLEYAKDGDCPSDTGAEKGDGKCYSFSNDASLLLPTSVLSGNYIVTGRAPNLYQKSVQKPDGSYEVSPTWVSTLGSFVSIAGADTKPVEVTVRFASRATTSYGDFVPGDEHTFQLKPGEVQQLIVPRPSESSCKDDTTETAKIGCGPANARVNCTEKMRYCAPQRDDDLTGTRITATGKVAVYSGSPCTFVPYNRFACDHLEEATPPLETWGRTVVVAITKPLKNEPNLVRVVSSEDGNAITFTSDVHEPVTLNAGEFVEFEARKDFSVSGTLPIQVSQYLVGQGYAGLQAAHDSVAAKENGDPSFTIVAPVEQYRTSYDFLAPSTYEQSWVVVTAPAGASVELDAQPVSGFVAIEGTMLQSARVKVSSGAHNLKSSVPFGVQIYGFGAFTSYMAPAGLNLDPINVL